MTHSNTNKTHTQLKTDVIQNKLNIDFIKSQTHKRTIQHYYKTTAQPPNEHVLHTTNACYFKTSNRNEHRLYKKKEATKLKLDFINNTCKSTFVI